MEQKVKDFIEKIIKNKFNNLQKVKLIPAKTFGDIATNIALQLGKDLKKDTYLIAKEIAQELRRAKFIKSVNVVAPGFINIFLKDNKLNEEVVSKILTLKENFGNGKQKQNINLEYVSVNPTGFLHIGHARGAITGSVLANILKKAGNKVFQEYYINDKGVQIEKLGLSVFIRYKQLLGIKKSLPSDAYYGNDIIFVAKKLIKEFGSKYKNSNFTNKVKELFSQRAKNILLAIIKKDLESLSVNMDLYFSEKSLYDDGTVEKSIKKLKKYIYKKDGALWLRTTDGGDDKDRVLVKENGEYTYFISDIAYHDNKLKRGFDKLINIWGADHIGYINRVKTSIEFLGFPREILKVLTVQLVKLVKNGHEVRMSKRTGNTYTLSTLKKDVGRDVVRFFITNRSANAPFNFDIEKVKEHSLQNPLYAIKYAYARAASLMSKSKVKPKVGKYQGKEVTVIQILQEFPSLIISIANSSMIHLLTQYLIKLSRAFNAFYSNCKVIGSEQEEELIALVKATAIVLKEGLKLVGIEAKDRI